MAIQGFTIHGLLRAMRLFLALCVCGYGTSAYGVNGDNLAPGVVVEKLERVSPISNRAVELVVVHVDLKKAQLVPLFPRKGKVDFIASLAKTGVQGARAADKGLGRLVRPLDVLAWATQAVRAKRVVAAMNGSFFFEDLRPMGLLIGFGKVLNPLRKVDWGVFSVDDRSGARLVHTRKWGGKPPLPEFAIQAGPRLVVDGKPLTFRENMARRSALCIRSSHEISLVATRHSVLLGDLAELLRRTRTDGGLGCSQALNLDGGSSSQIWVGRPGLNLFGFDRVPVGLGVVSRGY